MDGPDAGGLDGDYAPVERLPTVDGCYERFRLRGDSAGLEGDVRRAE